MQSAHADIRLMLVILVELSVKVILTCCDNAYPFTAVVTYPVMYVYIYTYLVLRSCLTDGQTLP